MKTRFQLLPLLLVSLATALAGGTPAPAPAKTPVIAMCEPTVSQIRNIEEMYEKDILPLKTLTLLCIYHENEETDFQPSFDYVKTNNLDWVKFKAVKGLVARSDLFAENAWTPQFREIFASADGIIFTGGMDIPPDVFGQEALLLSEVTTPLRSLYEISFLFHLVGGSQNPSFRPLLAERPHFPILAICLGAQTLNVAAGGTLIQDIPTQVYGLKTVEQVLQQDPQQVHSSLYWRKLNPGVMQLAPAFHQIAILKNSIFDTRMGISAAASPYVLSSHHQAIDRLGQNLAVAARSLDGRIIEAVEHRRFDRVLGIQFHPEPYSLYRKGLRQRQKPGGPLDFNPRSFLAEHANSLVFHRDLWKWFCSCL